MEQLNTIFAAFVTAINASTEALAGLALPILHFGALVYLAWFILGTLMRGGGQFGEFLGEFLFRIISIGFVMWTLGHWVELTSGIFEAFLKFGKGGSGVVDARDLLTRPAAIWEVGLVVMRPIADFSTWKSGLASTWSLTTNPADLLAWIFISIAFLLATIHHGMLLVEFALATCVGIVMVPWYFLRPVSHLAEFGIGWISGTCIRAMVSVAILTIGLPIFQGMTATQPSAPGWLTDPLGRLAYAASVAPSMGYVVSLVGSSFLFAVLVWTVPGRAARLAGAPALALTGSDVMAGAMSTARFVMGGRAAIQGASRLVASVRG